jgi:hypothetical protein
MCKKVFVASVVKSTMLQRGDHVTHMGRNTEHKLHFGEEACWKRLLQKWRREKE